MKVFISSVIKGYEKYRTAAREAVHHVRQTGGVALEPVMAEVDFPSLPISSQEACLQGVKDCDIYVLVMGARYGWVNPKTGLSATHEEYQTAVQTGKPVLAFIQATKRDAVQQKFVDQVSSYTAGVFRSTFRGESDLRLKVEHALANHVQDVKQTPHSEGGTWTQTVNVHGAGAITAQKIDTINIERKK